MPRRSAGRRTGHPLPRLRVPPRELHRARTNARVEALLAEQRRSTRWTLVAAGACLLLAVVTFVGPWYLNERWAGHDGAIEAALDERYEQPVRYEREGKAPTRYGEDRIEYVWVDDVLRPDCTAVVSGPEDDPAAARLVCTDLPVPR